MPRAGSVFYLRDVAVANYGGLERSPTGPGSTDPRYALDDAPEQGHTAGTGTAASGTAGPEPVPSFSFSSHASASASRASPQPPSSVPGGGSLRVVPPFYLAEVEAGRARVRESLVAWGTPPAHLPTARDASSYCTPTTVPGATPNTLGQMPVGHVCLKFCFASPNSCPGLFSRATTRCVTPYFLATHARTTLYPFSVSARRHSLNPRTVP